MNIKASFQKRYIKTTSYLMFVLSLACMSLLANAMEQADGETALVNAAQQSLTVASDQLQNMLQNYQQVEQDPHQFNDHIGANIGFLHQTAQSLEQIQERSRELLGQPLEERDIATNRLLTATVSNIRRNVNDLADSLERMRRDHSAYADCRQGNFRTRLAGLARIFARSWRPHFVLNYRQRLQEVSQREQAILGQMHTLFDILGNRRYNLPQRVDRQPMPAIDMVTGHEYEQQPQTVLNQTNRAFMFSMLPASLRDELRDLRNILSSGQPDDEQPDDDQSADVHVQLHQLANNLRARQTNDFQRNMNLFVQNIGGQRIQRLNRFLDHRAFDYGSATNLLDNLPASSPFRFRLLEALYRTADNNPSAQQNLHNESQDAHDGDLGRQEQQSWWQRLWGKIKYNSARLVRGVLRKIVGHDKLDNMVSINARYLAFIAGIRNRVQAIDRMQNDVRGIRDNVRSFVNPDRFQQIDETVIRNDVLRTHIERMAQGWQQEQPAHIEG